MAGNRKGIMRKMRELIREKRRSMRERRNRIVIDVLTMKDTEREAKDD